MKSASLRHAALPRFDVERGAVNPHVVKDRGKRAGNRHQGTFAPFYLASRRPHSVSADGRQMPVT